jgi:hypothetical protein
MRAPFNFVEKSYLRMIRELRSGSQAPRLNREAIVSQWHGQPFALLETGEKSVVVRVDSS